MWSKKVLYLNACLLIYTFSEGQNFVSDGSGTLTLINTNYFGNNNSVAGDVRNYDVFESFNVSYLGYTNSASSTSSLGGIGLRVNDVGLTVISNSNQSQVKGGVGGIVTSTSVGSTIVQANGGLGVQVNDEHDPFSNLYGGPGAQQVNIADGIILGGNAGTVIGLAGNTGNADGGVGVFSENVTLTLGSASVIGGHGGTAQGSQGTLSANGGNAITTGFNVNLNDISNSFSLIGGDGGSVTSTVLGVSATASGGVGFDFQGLNLDLINYPQPRDTSLTNYITHGEFTGGAGGVAVGQSSVNADGGRGVFTTLQLMTVSNGTFQGGAGGSVTASSSVEGSAKGGDGFYSFQNHKLTILGGEFYGGDAGIVNGVNDENGVGLRAVDTDVLIKNGSFYGRGVIFSSETLNSIINIDGGNFDSINLLASSSNLSSGVISGGNISNLILSGYSNELTTTGGAIDKLSLSGEGENTLNLGAGNTLSSIESTSGTSIVNSWNDSHFTDTTINAGSIIFNNQDFSLDSGSSFNLLTPDASAYFNGSQVNIRSNAIYDAGYGLTTAQVFNVESGASIRSVLSSDGDGGYDLPNINVSELIISSNATWTVHSDGTYSNFSSILETDGLLLAEAINGISNSITASDVVLSGQGWDQYWMYGISELYTKTNNANGEPYEFYARYGIQDLSSALEATGDLSVLLNSIQSNVLNNTSARDLLVDFGSSTAASDQMTKGFLRTTEMGSTLAGAQSVLSDQIGIRTREHLRSFRLAGKTGPSGARGPASWWDRSMNRLHDALPSFNLRDSMRSAQDRVSESNFSNERYSVKKPWISGVQGGAIPSFTTEIEIPSHYQTWGRAYVADLDQESTDGFAGYDAYVQGGVLGLDRRFDNAVVGVAGGLSKTRVTSVDGHSGEADSLQSTVYASYFTDRFYLNAHVSFASSDVETDGVSSFGYRSEYDAKNLSFFVGAGVGYKGFNDSLIITPEVSLLSSKYSRDGYTSTSSMSQTLGFEDMVFDSYDQWSYQSELGVAISSMKLIENLHLQMAFQPEFRVHWVHEFEPNPDAERYHFAGSTQNLHAQLQSREENLIRIGGGVRCWSWNSRTTEFGLNLDNLKGDAYTEWMFSAHFIHRF